MHIWLDFDFLNRRGRVMYYVKLLIDIVHHHHHHDPLWRDHSNFHSNVEYLLDFSGQYQSISLDTK